MTETALEKHEPNLVPMKHGTSLSQMGQLLQVALENNAAMDVIERMAALVEKERDYQARVDFDDALNDCQKSIGRIAPDKNREKGIQWASYAAIDRVIRPIYTRYGFSLAFSQIAPMTPNHMNVKAKLSRSGKFEEFTREVPVVVPGQTSLADAEEAAYSRAQRYLVGKIFNIAVGVDEAEMAPFGGLSPEQAERIEELIGQMKNSENFADCKDAYAKAYAEARKLRNNSLTLTVIETFEQCKRELEEKQ